MSNIAIIMVIRRPDNNDSGYIDTYTDVLDDDEDDTLTEWIHNTISNFFEEENIEYNDLDTFLEDYYGNDSEEELFPFQVSYFNIDKMKWEYLSDEYIMEILDNWYENDEDDYNDDYND